MDAEQRLARIARNEASFRDINERLRSGLRGVAHPPERLEFICECGHRDCEETIELTFEEYEAVRRDSRHFAVVPGHGIPEAERVIADHGNHQVVEKLGAAVEVADAQDRRSPGPGGLRDD